MVRFGALYFDAQSGLSKNPDGYTSNLWPYLSNCIVFQTVNFYQRSGIRYTHLPKQSHSFWGSGWQLQETIAGAALDCSLKYISPFGLARGAARARLKRRSQYFPTLVPPTLTVTLSPCSRPHNFSMAQAWLCQTLAQLATVDFSIQKGES